jgi:hypothetical protein
MKLYHGSSDEYAELDGSEPGYRGSLGYGLYLTTDETFAAKFGDYIHEVVSPVPWERVAYIEPTTWDCGNDLTLYTPGSVPFMFEISDRKTGKKHRYSVLEDCEEQVKAALGVYATGEYKMPKEVAAAGLTKVAELVAGAVASGKDEGDAIEAVLTDMTEADMAEDLVNAAGDILTDMVDDMQAYVEKRVEELLGEEIALDDLSATAERHGYSAFFIEGYAPGDEYVIFDEKYLPVPVVGITKV